MKSNDFSQVEADAIELQRASRGLVEDVTDLVSPAAAFSARVNDTSDRIATLEEKLVDLQNRSDEAFKLKTEAFGLNFNNEGSKAGFTVEIIKHYTEEAEQVRRTPLYFTMFYWHF